MREVLRLVDATQESLAGAEALRGYNLEVYAGDIVVVHGMAGSGLNGLLGLLNGTNGLVSGRIYIDEAPAPLRRDRSPQWEHISIFGDTRHQFEQLTVAENLALFSARHGSFTRFDRRAVNARAARYLREESLDISPTAVMASLSFFERQQLNLLMAKMAHATLIVIDCTEAAYGEEMSGALLSMMRRFRAEGMAFLLIAYRDSIYEGLATRFQRIAFGADVMEWDGAARRAPSHREEAPPPRRAPMIDGICDEAIDYMDVRDYLREFCRCSPGCWERICGVPIPAAEGLCERGGVALVPRQSANLLAENLSIEDNVILTIPDRIERGRWGYIPSRLSRAAASGFYRATGIDAGKRRPGELTLVERKILSIYRWEQRRPGLMVLAIPHYGMDRLEGAQLDRYLLHLVDRGIRLLILSDSMQELRPLCERITVAEQGREARIVTEPAEGGPGAG